MQAKAKAVLIERLLWELSRSFVSRVPAPIAGSGMPPGQSVLREISFSRNRASSRTFAQTQVSVRLPRARGATRRLRPGFEQTNTRSVLRPPGVAFHRQL